MIDLRSIIAEAGGPGLYGDEERAATAFLNEWHGAGANEHGYVAHGETVLLAETGRSCAKARIIQTRRGHWLLGHDYSNATAGYSGGPSVWNREAYESRDEAVRAAAGHASKWFGAEIVTTNSCVSPKTRAEAGKIVKVLESLITPPPARKPIAPKMMQLDLFG